MLRKNNYKLFLIVALFAVCFIYMYDIGAIYLNSEIMNKLIFEYPFLENNDILINIISFFYHFSENLSYLSEGHLHILILMLFHLIFILASFALIFIFPYFLTEIFTKNENKITINIILFCILTIYLIYYPLHIFNHGCASPIIFVEFFKIGFFIIIFSFSILVLLLSLYILISILTYSFIFLEKLFKKLKIKKD